MKCVVMEDNSHPYLTTFQRQSLVWICFYETLYINMGTLFRSMSIDVSVLPQETGRQLTSIPDNIPETVTPSSGEVHCDRRQLAFIPKNIPETVTRLDLEDNSHLYHTTFLGQSIFPQVKCVVIEDNSHSSLKTFHRQ